MTTCPAHPDAGKRVLVARCRVQQMLQHMLQQDVARLKQTETD
jgi:hypothetical protein